MGWDWELGPILLLPDDMDKGLLSQLNNNLLYDFTHEAKIYYNEDDLVNPCTIDNKSPYFDIDTFTKAFKKTNKPIFLSINIQSLMSKIDNLKALISQCSNNNVSIDVIAIQESWKIHYPELIQIPGYNFFHQDRSKSNGGGVGFYIKQSYPTITLPNLSPFNEKIFETLTLEVTINKKKYLLSNIYRSPSPSPNISQTEQLNNFISDIDNHLTLLNSKKLKTVIFTDANINLLKINSDPIISNYLETLLNNGFSQTIHKATRIQNQSYSLIDHIFTNDDSSTNISGTLICDVSDHFATFFQPNSYRNFTHNHSRTTRDFSKTNLTNFKNALNSLRWANVLRSDDVDESFSLFWNEFSTLFNLYLPEKTTRFNKNKVKINDFMTKGLLTSRLQKNKLHKIAIKEPTSSNLNAYKTYRNIFNATLRKSKKLYYETNLLKYKKNPKKTWQLLKEATGMSSKQETLAELDINGKISNDPLEMANHFNEFFTNIGKVISNSVPTSTTNPTSYCNYPEDVPTLHLGGIGPIHFTDLVKAMPSKNSTDLDGISTFLLKQISYEISVPLAHIFNLSLTRGVFPAQLKTTRIVPINKAGDPTNCDNYRPISLVKTFPKILEKLVCNKLVNHLELNKLLYNHQYGFLRGRSTEHALIDIMNYISKAINDNKYCIGIFLDFKKAFDVVPHNILLKKLELLGIKDVALNWFESYLSNRNQKVDIHGKLSSSRNLDLSVFQGTSLGPILFLCFINDLPNATKLLSILFADDTTCLNSNTNLSDLINECNTELYKLAEWLKCNKMTLNVSKTKFIIFHNPNKRINLENIQLVWNDNPLNSVHDPKYITPIERIHNKHTNPSLRTFKLLGIYLDEHLNFNANTSKLCAKISKSIFIINRAKNLLNEKSLRTLYFSLVHSHLLYCPIIYSCTSQNNLNRLIKLQKKIIRIITHSDYREHTEPLFNNLKILPFNKILIERKGIFMHSVFYNYAPTSLLSTWNSNADRNLNLRNNNDLSIPFARTENLRRHPFFSLPYSWNSLKDLRFQHNPTTFRIALNDQLINPPNHDTQTHYLPHVYDFINENGNEHLDIYD